MPSYRPQAKASHRWSASRRAVACVKGSPAGDGTTRVGAADGSPKASRPPASTWARAPPRGWGRMTMPAPPPSGASSTVRCRSRVKSRRSCTSTWRIPARRALPSRERSSGARYSGKIVTTSRRISLRVVEQARRRVDDDDAGGDVHGRDEGGDERHEPVGTVRAADDEQVLGGRVLDGDA